MPLDAATKNQLAQFGRTVSLLFNRSMMYQPNHPFVEQSVEMFLNGAAELTKVITPLVFILNREAFFIDEEPLDPRLNVSRLITLFKNHGLQSISIEPGLGRREIKVFLEVFSEISRYGNAEGFKKAIFARGVTRIKVNHVRYKKVTEGDEIIARHALDGVKQMMIDADEAKNRKMFMDTLLESVLSEEFTKTLTIESLMANPGAVSKNMIEADLAHGVGDGPGTADASGGSGDGGAGPGDDSGSRPAGAGSETGSSGSGESAGGGKNSAGGYGGLLFQQLELMRIKVEARLDGERDVALTDLAGAVFDMKKQLLAGIEAQKTLGIAYENEAAIRKNADELTDRVLMQLIRAEYQQGRISPARMAQIIRRLLPEPAELKRLLPAIKRVLIEEGMTQTQFMVLIQELGKELQGESLVAILQESGEVIGVDGDQLIAEFKRNPEQAAQLIYLAAEIRRGTGDDDTLADILAGYVEQVGSHVAMDEAGDRDDPEHLKQVVRQIESKIIGQLGTMDVGADVIAKLEDRLNSRMEAILDQMRPEWMKSRGRDGVGGGVASPQQPLSVLRTLEQSVSEHDELGTFLKIVRQKVEAGEIDENDYKRIQREIFHQKQLAQAREADRVMPVGVIKAGAMAFILEKEIARANRYDYAFSVLAFSMVRINPRVKVKADRITNEILMESVLARLAETFREVDILGQLGKNTITAVLPLINREDSKKALNRVMKILQEDSIMVRDVPVDVKFAGIAMTFDGQQTPDAKSFIRVLSGRLQDMANRLKNVQTYL